VAVVEDNRPLADSLCLLLDLVGYDCRAAYTGPDGLRLAADWHPDAVITDIGLPGCDGFEVTRALRRSPGEKRPLVVAVTAYGDEGCRQRAREGGPTTSSSSRWTRPPSSTCSGRTRCRPGAGVTEPRFDPRGPAGPRRTRDGAIGSGAATSWHARCTTLR
jgi:CheY-like chemotaxis protein